MGPKKSPSTKSTAAKSSTKPASKVSSSVKTSTHKKEAGTSKKVTSSSSLTTASKTNPQAKNSSSKEVLPTEATDSNDFSPVVECKLAEIADVLIESPDKKIKDGDKWPLLIDPSGNGVTFLKYRYTNYLCTLNENDMSVERLRPALIGAIRYGKPLILDMMDVDHMDHIATKLNAIQDNLFQEIVSKEIMKNKRYLSLVRPSDDEDEYNKEKFTDMFLLNFIFLIATKITDIPQQWYKTYSVVKVN